MSDALRVLNVGGGLVPVPEAQYKGWDVDLLDIDPAVSPDILLDARELATLPAGTYDAVYCSHNLEHYHEHEVGRVLYGFAHVLKAGGFADIRVPDVGAVIEAMTARGLDLDAVLYQAPVGPIRLCDVLWGYARQIRESGKDYYSHKTGFTKGVLGRTLARNGFAYVLMGGHEYELRAVAFKRKPSDARLIEVGMVSQNET